MVLWYYCNKSTNVEITINIFKEYINVVRFCLENDCKIKLIVNMCHLSMYVAVGYRQIYFIYEQNDVILIIGVYFIFQRMMKKIKDCFQLNFQITRKLLVLHKRNVVFCVRIGNVTIEYSY